MTKTGAQESKTVAWHVSTYSDSSGGSCVEAGPVTGYAQVAVRDTKNRSRGRLTISHATWAAFVRSVTRCPFTNRLAAPVLTA